jgi:hypothetical protein
MTPYFCYLSGPISGLTYGQATDWREYATQCFPPHIQGVSPMRAKRYLDDGNKLGADQPYTFPLSSDRASSTRNRVDTWRSSAILINLLNAEEVSIGTAMEIAWACDRGIPIVAAMEPEGNVHDHPMVRDCITVRVSSLDEAIEAVVELVSPHQGMMWTRIEQVKMLSEENLVRFSHRDEDKYSDRPRLRRLEPHPPL